MTGEEVHGGVQLRVVGLTADALPGWRQRKGEEDEFFGEGMAVCCAAPPDMGLGAGGRMRQEVYSDDRDLGDYDPDRSWRVFVHLCSAEEWTAITGEVPPPSPVDRDPYVQAGLPWFGYYDVDGHDLPAPEKLAKVASVGTMLGVDAPPHLPVHPGSVITLKDAGGDTVGDGTW